MVLPQISREKGFDPWFGRGTGNAARCAPLGMFDHNQYVRDSGDGRAEIIGRAVRSPLADRRLLEFVLTVPEPMFCRNGVGRSFARRVLADRLPREIAEETRLGVPETAWFRKLELPSARPYVATWSASRLLRLPAGYWTFRG